MLVTEVSRLSRRNSDWHRVIELCAVFRTLIADEDGIYDAQDPNDRLLLGVKGTLFAAELHILQRPHARQPAEQGPARRARAARCPVGYRRLGDGAVVLDPDEEVRLDAGADLRALRRARATPARYSATSTSRACDAAPDPGRRRGGSDRLGPADLQMIQQVLTSPVYAGVVRLRSAQTGDDPGDPPTVTERRRPMEEWDIVVPGVYPAYVSYDQYLPIVGSCATTCITSPPRDAARPRGTGVAARPDAVRPLRAADERSAMAASYRRYQCRRAQLDYAAPRASRSRPRHLDALSRRAVPRGGAASGFGDHVGGSRGARARATRHSTVIGSCASSAPATRRERAQRQYDAVEPENRWSPASWRRAGTLRCGRSRAAAGVRASLQRTELRPLEGAEQERCGAWLRICPRSGTPPRPPPSTASACCGWS